MYVPYDMSPAGLHDAPVRPDCRKPVPRRELSELRSVCREQRRIDVEQGPGTARGLEGRFEILWTSHRRQLELQSQGACRFLRLSPLYRVGWMPRMRQDRHLLQYRDEFPEQFQALGDSRASVDRQSGDVAAGACQALD
jgi:hypothetical protein